MKTDYYEAIFKRKSFHLFRGVGNDRLGEDELEMIHTAFEEFERLYPDIRMAIRIIPARNVDFKRDAEYCILMYSEKKDNYLMNAGFVGEQLDLWLVEHRIGSLWFGLGKPDQTQFDGLDFVIMFAIRKVNNETKFRKEMFKAKRKPLAETWSGEEYGVADVARFAPSACNSQPWFVKSEEGVLTVCRYKKPGRHGILTVAAAAYFNRIDIGIYLCFLEICLERNGVEFDRELFSDPSEETKLNRVTDLIRVAVYTLRKPE